MASPDPVAAFHDVLPRLPPGQVRSVVAAPAPVLSTPAAEVDPGAAEVAQLAADLLATQEVSPGCVGLAAPQIGVPSRVFSLDVTGHPKTRVCHGRLVLANPRLVDASRQERGREGCMSVPDLTGDVRRATRVRVIGMLPVSGVEVVLETDAFEARALQHELDHLDGRLFLDRVVGAHAVFARKVYL